MIDVRNTESPLHQQWSQGVAIALGVGTAVQNVEQASRRPAWQSAVHNCKVNCKGRKQTPIAARSPRKRCGCLRG